MKEEPGVKAGYDPQYYKIAELPFNRVEYDALYSKYFDRKMMEGEMESQTRQGTIRFSLVRNRLDPLIWRYPNIHRRINALLVEETPPQDNLNDVLLAHPTAP